MLFLAGALCPTDAASRGDIFYECVATGRFIDGALQAVTGPTFDTYRIHWSDTSENAYPVLVQSEARHTCTPAERYYFVVDEHSQDCALGCGVRPA